MLAHDGFLIAVPEYNSTMPACFKNMIDWTSRPTEDNEVYLCCFINKVITLMSASPGSLGGLRGLVHVRAMFSNLYSIVLPQQKCIPDAYTSFTADGQIKDKKAEQEVLNLGVDLAKFLQKLHT